ncbi:class I SAM-dependent methyltransferase [Calditrichota bacterium GD2]
MIVPRAFPIIRSFASYFLPNKILKKSGSGGTFRADYCYSVWLRHLVMLHKSKLIRHVDEIKNIAEIGPGDSLGIGISAIFCGINNYYAFDVIKHANSKENIKIAQEIKNLYLKGQDIPYQNGFENTNPKLEDYSFPTSILPDYITDQSYLDKRLKQISKALFNKQSEIKIEYVVPWNKLDIEPDIKLDLIYSQAVMEHILDIDYAYHKMYEWLRVGGIISHQIDFKSHEMTKEWNGHWFINDTVWKFLMHGRKYPINRFPLSVHLTSIKNTGFTIKKILPVINKTSLDRRKSLKENIEYIEEDFLTSSALIIAQK